MKLSPELIESINQRLEHAAREHPEGPSIEALKDEVREVEHAISNDNYRYELIDVITVALRLLSPPAMPNR